MPLPRALATVLFGALQCGVTTGAATALATLRHSGVSAAAIYTWLSSWMMSWAMLLPIVIALAPLLQRLVNRLTSGREADHAKRNLF